MQSHVDLIIKIFCVAVFSILVGAHVWAIYYRCGLGMKHLDNPALVKEDIVNIKRTSMMGIAMAVSLGMFIVVLVKKV